MNAERWLLTRNIEVLWCQLPGYEQVMNGSHLVYAVGNDGMGVAIEVQPERMQGIDTDEVDIVELMYITRALMNLRMQEMAHA